MTSEAVQHYGDIHRSASRLLFLIFGAHPGAETAEHRADRQAHPALAGCGRFDLEAGVRLVSQWSGYRPALCREVLEHLCFV